MRSSDIQGLLRITNKEIKARFRRFSPLEVTKTESIDNATSGYYYQLTMELVFRSTISIEKDTPEYVDEARYKVARSIMRELYGDIADELRDLAWLADNELGPENEISRRISNMLPHLEDLVLER